MTNRTVCVFALGLCAFGCAKSRDVAAGPPPELIAKLERAVAALEPGMSEDDVNARIRFDKIKPYIGMGEASGPASGYGVNYHLRNRVGVLSYVYDGKELKGVQFWNKKTGVTTRSKGLKPTRVWTPTNQPAPLHAMD
jgi:hypothetical protein